MSTLSTLRRVVAGIVLFVVAVLLSAASTASGSRVGLVLGLAILAGWGVAGVAIFAGNHWGRILGLGASAIGLLVGWSLATSGIESPLTEVMFSPPDAVRWYVVMPAGYLFAALSAVAGLLLLLPFPTEATSAQPGTNDDGPLVTGQESVRMEDLTPGAAAIIGGLETDRKAQARQATGR